MTTKRKSSDHRIEHNLTEPPSKRLRPSTLPPLPPITPEFEQYVFTHPSAASKANNEDSTAIHYDRLEFLGDAHLQLIATNAIYQRYSDANAGRMAQIRQQLVQNETLCRHAQDYGFDKRLKINMGASDALNQGKHKSKFSLTKVYGDVFEAYIGAITLSFSPSDNPSHGITAARDFLTALWEPVWPELEQKFPSSIVGKKDLLSSKIVVPGVRLDYVEEKKAIVHVGKGIETYFVGVYLTGWGYTNQHLGSAKGMNKSQAGQAAAMAALEGSARLIEGLIAKKKEWLSQREAEREQAKIQRQIAAEAAAKS